MRLLWLVGVAFGALMIIKTEWILETFGKSGWAEQHLGTEGGTRLLYKLIGVAFIIISFLGLTGMLGGVVFSIFGRFFGA